MLLETINSILDQTYKNVEIIVVDDNSSMDYYSELKKIKNVKYIKNKTNYGAGKSRNIGYAQSLGDYIIFCDDDDLYIDKHFFERSIIDFSRDTTIDMIFANSYIWYEKENKNIPTYIGEEGTISCAQFLENFQIKYSKPNSTFTAIFKKECLEKANFFDLQMMNDSTIYLNALPVGNNILINSKMIGKYRIHSMNISFNMNSNFIIENLNEKKNLYTKYKENLPMNDKWFYNQILITCQYFIIGSNPNKNEKQLLYNWIKSNIEDSKQIIIKLRITDYKNRIKIFLKRR